MQNYTNQQWKGMLDKIECLDDIPDDLSNTINEAINSGNDSEFIGYFENDVLQTMDQMETSAQITVYYDNKHHYPAFNFESYGSIDTGGECRNLNRGDDEESTITIVHVPFFKVIGYDDLKESEKNLVDQKIKYNKNVKDQESKMKYDFIFDPSYKVRKYWDDYAKSIGCHVDYREKKGD